MSTHLDVCLSLTSSADQLVNEMKETSLLEVVYLSRMQAQAVFLRFKLFNSFGWCYCQNLNQDSTILLQGEDLVRLINIKQMQNMLRNSSNFDLKI